MVKRFKANGAAIKRLRSNLEQHSLQKEFASYVGISVRRIRNIENENAEITGPEADRLASKLGRSREDIVFATDQPRLVLPPAPPAQTSTPALYSLPRFDTAYIRACTDGGLLFENASQSHVVIAHVRAVLNGETAQYAEELINILDSLSWANRDRFSDIAASRELSARRRLGELLVLLKGNDVWVYAEHHTKHLPESYEVQLRLGPDYEWQTIIAFGPPGEYGENTIKVDVDNGQPWQGSNTLPF